MELWSEKYFWNKWHTVNQFLYCIGFQLNKYDKQLRIIEHYKELQINCCNRIIFLLLTFKDCIIDCRMESISLWSFPFLYNMTMLMQFYQKINKHTISKPSTCRQYFGLFRDVQCQSSNLRWMLISGNEKQIIYHSILSFWTNKQLVNIDVDFELNHV